MKKEKNFHLIGAVLVFLGAVCFSIKAILIKLAYRYHVDATPLLTLRMAFSLPFFLIIPFLHKRNPEKKAVTRRDIWKIIGLGILGYYAASIFDFIGLKYVSASLERLILFIYPTLVLVIQYFVYRTPITLKGYVSLLLTYIGIFIVFREGLAFKGNQLWIGAVFIFGSAVTYASYLVGSGKLIPRIGSVIFNSYAMIVSSLAVIIHYFITGDGNLIFTYQAEVYYYALAIAIISTVIPTFLVSEGINLIGAGRAAIIASVGPVTTIMMDHLYLHEPFSFNQVFGTLFVLAGVLLVGVKK